MCTAIGGKGVENARQDALPDAIRVSDWRHTFEAIEKGGEIEELLGLDYSRLTVALLGGLKAITARVAELESRLQ